MKKYQLYLFSVLSGLLLAFAWFPHGLIPLLFIAFVPLLVVEHVVFQSEGKYKTRTLFFCAYITFFLWNILTTWWIKNASFGGAVMAIVLSSLFMTIFFIVFHKTKKRIGEKWGTIGFISFWIAFEFLYHGDDITWPWLTLGNAFADSVGLIQWYEYTGIFGGSLWVLIVNCLIFSMITYEMSRKKMIITISVVVLPIILSFLIARSYDHTPDPSRQKKIVIVQPNIDPYNEKFSGSYEEQLHKMLVLGAEKTDSTTDYLILPETALIEEIWEDQFDQSTSIQTLKKYLIQFPKLKIIIGASTLKAYSPQEPLSSTARKFNNDDSYYDAYNTALQLDNSGKIQLYHKSKLVPGVERMPFQFIFKYLDKYTIALGGTTGSLGTQKERTVFSSPDGTSKAAPVVCYESIYGEYVATYVKNGAQFISIITNDGWWGDTPGYHQHLKYGRLRAIENRRWIARSANTGTSCFIDPLGKVYQATDWWVPASISGTIELNSDLTFYTRFGDYIGRIAMYAAFLLIIYSWLIRFRIVKKS